MPGATFVAVRHEFLEQLEEQLHDDFETAEGFLTPATGGRVVWSGDRQHDPDDDEDAAATSGRPTARSSLASAPQGLCRRSRSAPPRPVTAYESIVANARRWRTLTGTALVGGRSVVVRASRSEDRLRAQLWEVLTVLVLGLPLVVALAGVGGYVLARRALTPIDQLASEARRITAERLHERVSVPNPARRDRTPGDRHQRHVRAPRILVRSAAPFHG